MASSSTLQFNLPSHNFNNNPLKSSKLPHHHHHLSFSRLKKIRALETANDAEPAAAAAPQEPPAVNFAFVSSVLLPDGMPDVHYRTACGGQKLRDVMLDNNVELYGPYARPLLNCGGGGTCGTCIVEVIIFIIPFKTN
ncbi:UNVERIFIED_CONTAM: Photosynthetic NDH subunit of subcomplex B 3, chloroplastic [Sesamum radiatum]|uniref:Photosynthetic NDH subunit of subcomplex B 3, chloroplastic n=1 Tax=Sesamum radiatum TaxID=300843 RepID=A0AAW2PET7_SESRA